MFGAMAGRESALRDDRGRYVEIGQTCLCLSLRKAARAITRYYDQMLKPSKLRATQLMILVAIASTGSTTLSSLAKTLVVERTTLTRNLNVLNHRGLVRMTAGGDRRTRVVGLTSAGRRAMKGALPLWERAQVEVRNHLGQRESRLLLKTMSEVVPSLRNE